MKFSIITPTYKRPDTLRRTIKSVLAQAHTNWEMIIINDNPDDNTKDILNDLNDSRLILLENKTNSGVNYTRNRGLATIDTDTNYVIFLDDDDYLAPDALIFLSKILNMNTHKWLLTARGNTESNPTTYAPHEGVFSYQFDYLITRKIKGDATHCIDANLIRKHRLHFPTYITQAEEWLFYFSLSQLAKIHYINKVTTLTDGYSTSGLNLRKRTIKEQLHTITLIYREAKIRKIRNCPNFWLYFAMRILRSFIKHT